MGKKVKWTVELAVDETWVADGFDLTAERARSMLANDLMGAHNHELGARIIKKPSATLIARLQGYPSAAAMHRANGRKL